MAKFIHYRQMDTMSCGPACLRMIARHFGKTLSMQQAEDLAYKGKQGVSLLAVCDAAEEMGLRSLPVQCGMDHLLAGRRVPFIAHWNQNHFVVVYHLTARHIYVADPAAEGLLRYSLAEFEAGWLSAETASGPRGIAVYFEVTPAFDAGETPPSKVNGEWRILRGYLASHQTLMVQLVLGTLLSAVLMFVSPFLTESLVDQGVQLGDRSFVTYFLIAQGCVLVGGTAIELIRSWVLLYVSSRLSVTLVADFLQAAMNLPLSFFDKRSSGDILQRLDDHQRIERFLTSHALDSLFSLVIVLVYGVIIARFSPEVFAVFALGATLSIIWVLKFLKARKQLDHRRFSQLSESRANEMELIRGITEIKLTGSEKQKRWGWERVQARLFKTHVSSMKLEQVQHSGSSLITSATMILTMGISANAVISGSMTLGTMMAISAMLGQLNVPLANFINLAQEGQNAIMSFRRMAEVNMAAPEDSPDGDYLPVTLGDIALTDVSFRYGDLSMPFVLNAISLVIPRGKTTAIVGSSGSGKTTLLKLLLKFYDPEHGDIQIGGTSLAHLKARDWRSHCSGVMQDGFVFYDTIARNIAVTDEPIDREQLAWAAELADIRGFIEKLPLGYNTKVGDDGIGLSGGQRQRVLIARAVYSRPEYLLLDEATSALDTQAEATVSRNFARMTKGMTKIIVAHRLSTVRDADNIIVLEAGRITEIGSHAALTRLRGRYFELIRNQLELGA